MTKGASDALARLERQAVDRQRQVLAAADGALDAVETRLATLDSELASQVRTGQPEDQETALALTMAGMTIEAMRRRRRHVLEERRQLADERDRQAEVLRQQIVDVKALEIAVARRQRQRIEEADKRSQIELDDLTIQRFFALST